MIHLGGYCTAGVVLVGADGSLAQKDNANLSLSKQNYERNRKILYEIFQYKTLVKYTMNQKLAYEKVNRV